MAGLQGRTLGGYQLTEQIASAGIAEVYRARPISPNGREVVIKVIYPEFARYPGFMPNFQHIVQTASRLANHPHILPVVASGEENGYLYLAAPYVAGGTLRDLMSRGGRLGAGDTAPFFQQLCSALAYAHSMNLAHGNLKPGNVFLYEGRHVMLGDFGMLWDIRQLDMNHSGSGTDVVEYLAPESFAGQFSQQSDIYSLGAILFAALTGRPPFSAARPADLRDAHMQYPPPRLGQVDPSLPPAIQALDPIIQQAMAKRPEDRFPSATALAQAIETTLKQQPVMLAAPPPRPSAQAPMQPSMQPAMPSKPLGQPGLQQPGVPGAWVAPGPIPPAAPVPGLAALPAPGGSTRSPLDPPFPPINGGQQSSVPLAQGWPAAPDPVQYTERVPAPQVARPLFSRPRLQSPGDITGDRQFPDTPAADPWAQLMPAIGDDPDWKPNGRPGANGVADQYDDEYSRPSAAVHGPAVRDDWRFDGNGVGAAASGMNGSNFPAEYSDFTDQRIAIRDDNYGMSRGDWGTQSGPHSDALRYRGDFSATELGLPRLTNPALQGELPPEWEDLLADEKLPSRADVGYGGSRKPAPARRDGPGSRGYSSASEPYPPGRPGSRQASQWDQAFEDGQSVWQPAVGKPGGQRAQPMPTLASVHQPAYKPGRDAPQNVRRPVQAARRSGRWTIALLLTFLLLVLAGSAGVVLAKPSMCPGTICTQANHYLHKHLSFLGPAGNANVLTATPTALTIHAISGSSTNLNVQVSNTGTDPAIWRATSSVAWLTISPASGTLAPGGTETLSMVATPLNVPPGNYSSLVTVTTADTSITIPVAATIAGSPKLQVSPNALSFTQCGVDQPFKVTNAGSSTLSYNLKQSDGSAISLSTTSGSLQPGKSVTVAVVVNCSAQVADYSVSVSSNGGNTTVTIHYA
ncbi:MAG TPA: protein kinase [Ktedonobacterales bacterium]|nr:protein kinase [Ktedonobacterales bacterium]